MMAKEDKMWGEQTEKKNKLRLDKEGLQVIEKLFDSNRGAVD